MTLSELVAGENLADNCHEPERLSKHFLCGLRSQPSKQELHESLELEQTTLGQAMARLTMLVNQEDHVNSYSNPITHAGMCTMSSPSPVSWQQLEYSCSKDAVTTALPAQSPS